MAHRTCARCGVSIDKRDSRSRHCSPLCRTRDYEGSRIGEIRPCDFCGMSYAATRGLQKYCSRPCRERADVSRNRDAYNARNAARRALERTAVVEVFDRMEIFDRDRWICQLCFTSIDWRLRGRSPAAPALDHVVPLSRGGGHARANVQAAHFGCNSRKRDALDIVILPVLARVA